MLPSFLSQFGGCQHTVGTSLANEKNYNQTRWFPAMKMLKLQGVLYGIATNDAKLELLNGAMSPTQARYSVAKVCMYSYFFHVFIQRPLSSVY